MNVNSFQDRENVNSGQVFNQGPELSQDFGQEMSKVLIW